MGKSIASRILDWFFPQRCLGCGAPDILICAFCRQTIRCHPKQDQADEFLQVFTLYDYRENPLFARLVKQWKYTGDQSILSYLWPASIKLPQTDFIVPVPLHPRRLAERGFNQSEQIAKCCAKATGGSVSHLLKRKRYTKQQAKNSLAQRRDNLANAFALRDDKMNLQGKSILLVDDVFTTGETIKNAARVLQNGAARVEAFCLFRSGD